MKVRCKTQCQKDRKILFKVNEEYDIDKEMYQKNKEFFEKIKENNRGIGLAYYSLFNRRIKL